MYNNAKELVNYDLSELYQILGRSLDGMEITADGTAIQSDFHINPNSDEEAKEHGTNSFEKLKEKIKNEICDKWDACNKIDELENRQDEMGIITAVSDVLSTSLIGIPVVLIAVIVCKIGIRKFCSCAEN